MADRILVALPDGQWLALDRETFTAALAAGTELMPPSPAALTVAPLFVDAAEMGRLTDTAPSWWDAAARNLDCPSIWVGKVRRFKVADCLAWLEQVQERSPDGRALNSGAAPRARA
jgi:hypothetical protein